MKKEGMAALEALLAAAQVLILAAVVCALLVTFWQTWLEKNEASRQRQWVTVAFAYLDQDLRDADQVFVTASELRILQGNREYIYRVTAENSFYRGLGSAFYPLGIVESVSFRLEGDLLWVELNFSRESYRCCYFLEGNK